MLFDLRSRGRRRTVQVVYIGLAVLIGAGLILFGVGTGSGGGGLFGAFTGGSSNNGASSAVTAQLKTATKRAAAHPSSATAWANLVTAHYSAANSLGYNSATSTYTASGKAQLANVIAAYAKYTKLTSTPSADTATLAAHAYGQLDQYSQAAATWQAVVSAGPGNLKGLECTALMSYAAGNTRVAQLAEAATLKKLPKAERKEVKTEIESAKKTKSVAVQTC